MDERRLIGEEQQARGVLVEPADGGDERVAAQPAWRQERVDVGALAFVVGTDEPHGLVQKEEKAVGMIERFAIDTDVVGQRFMADVVGRFAADRDTAVVDPAARFAT